MTLVVSFHDEFREHLQVCAAGSEWSDGLTGLINQPSCTGTAVFESHQSGVSEFSEVSVTTGCFSHPSSVARDIQKVISNLERQANA
jgi:hypothetical protein